MTTIQNDESPRSRNGTQAHREPLSGASSQGSTTPPSHSARLEDELAEILENPDSPQLNQQNEVRGPSATTIVKHTRARHSCQLNAINP